MFSFRSKPMGTWKQHIGGHLEHPVCYAHTMLFII